MAAPAAAIPSAEIASQLSLEHQQEWVACVERLQQLGLSPEESDKTITRAMGWSSQVYWLKDKVGLLPSEGCRRRRRSSSSSSRDRVRAS